MDIVRVNLGTRSYDIRIEKGILKEIDFREFRVNKYAIITDSNVRKLYGGKLQTLIQNQGLEVELFDFPAGESSKNWALAGEIGRELVRKEFNRNSMIIALGGGIVGDLAGFVASLYERGIDYIQIPTTLLAQVDSSIGGKTGVNIPEGKNLFGSFYQPKTVFIDIEFLKTLPEKEIKNGLAEIIKYGIIQDSELFQYLEESVLNRADEVYLRIIKRCCEIKARTVEQDEKEKELRKILNYGHTIGHAIETAEEYRISHGEAIGLGMAYEGKISNKLGLLNDKDLQRQNQLIQAVGLPVVYEGNVNDLIKIMKRDKKVRLGELHFILPTQIGKIREENGQFAFPIDISIVKDCFKQ